MCNLRGDHIQRYPKCWFSQARYTSQESNQRLQGLLSGEGLSKSGREGSVTSLQLTRNQISENLEATLQITRS